VKDELLDIIGQSLALPENIPGAVEEDMAHPSMMGNTEGKVLPVHGLEVAEDAIDGPQGRFQIRVSFVMSSHDRVPVRDGFEDRLVGFVTDALALDREVEEGLGAEYALFLSLGITTGRPDERSKHSRTVS